MKEIIIRTNFDKKIGLGHFLRSKAIEEELVKKKFKITYIIDNKIVSNVTKNLNVINLGLKKFDPQYDSKKVLKIIKNKKVSLIIVDDYRIDFKWESFFLEKGYKIAVLDDLANRKHKCNFIIDSGWYGINGNHKRYSNLVNRDAIKLFGPKYKIINPKLKKKKIKGNNILIYFGGGKYIFKYQKLINFLIKKLEKLKLNKINVSIVISDLFKSKIKFYSKNIKIKIINNSYDLANTISNTSLFIGSNSSIVNELSFLNIPRILIPVNKLQNVDIINYQDLGNYFYIGYRKKIDQIKFAELVITIINNYRRVKKLHEKKNLNLDLKGTKRIVSKLLLRVKS